jgi:hypothetical protein
LIVAFQRESAVGGVYLNEQFNTALHRDSGEICFVPDIE